MFKGVKDMTIINDDTEGSSPEEMMQALLEFYVKGILAPPNTVFPAETTKLIYENVVIALASIPRKSLAGKKRFAFAQKKSGTMTTSLNLSVKDSQIVRLSITSTCNIIINHSKTDRLTPGIL